MHTCSARMECLYHRILFKCNIPIIANCAVFNVASCFKLSFAWFLASELCESYINTLHYELHTNTFIKNNSFINVSIKQKYATYSENWSYLFCASSPQYAWMQQTPHDCTWYWRWESYCFLMINKIRTWITQCSWNILNISVFPTKNNLSNMILQEKIASYTSQPPSPLLHIPNNVLRSEILHNNNNCTQEYSWSTLCNMLHPKQTFPLEV